MAWDVVARALFVDNGASAGLAKFNASIHEVTKAAPGGTRGFYMMERGLQTLAAEAVGVTGPIGKIAEGLLKFGGGSALVLGVAAGVGAIAYAYKVFTQAARDAQKAQDDFLTSLAKTPQGAATLARNALQTAEEKLTQMEARQRRATTAGKVLTGGLFTLGGYDPSELEAQRALVAKLAIEAKVANQNATDAAGHQTDAIRHLNEETKKLLETERERARVAKLAGIESAQADIALYRGELLRRRRVDFTSPTFGGFSTDTNDPLRSGRGTTFGQGLILDQFQGSVFGRRPPTPRFTPTEGAAKTDWLKTGEILAQGFFQAVTAFKAGGTGGLFGGIGALASAGAGVQGISKGLGSALGIVGFIGSALGGLFSLFDHSAERRQREQMAELTRIRQNTDKRGQPDHISVVVSLNGKEVSGAILQDVMYGIRRAERSNAVPVLPPAGG